MFNYHDGDEVPWPTPCARLQTPRDGVVLDVLVGRVVMLKVPTPYYFESINRELGTGFGARLLRFIDEYISLIFLGAPKYPIRRPRLEELPANVSAALRKYPRLAQIAKTEVELHWAVLTKLNDVQLRERFGRAIPESALVRLIDPNGLGWEAVIQRRITGPSLTEMVGHHGEIKDEFLNHASAMVAQLQRFADTPDIDCSFTNFVFEPDSGILFYIESKPPLFRTKRRNEFWRRALRSCIDRYAPA